MDTHPHYTEIAKHFGVPPEDGKKLVRELAEIGLPVWLYPGTDLIASCAPFNNLPTQYTVSVDGRRGCSALCCRSPPWGTERLSLGCRRDVRSGIEDRNRPSSGRLTSIDFPSAPVSIPGASTI